MLKETDADAAALRKQMTTPTGAMEQAVQVFQDGRLEPLFRPGKILIALPHSRDLSSVDASFFGLAHAKRKKGYLPFIDPTRDWNR